MARKDIQTLTLFDLDNAYSQIINFAIDFDDVTQTTASIFITNYGGDYALRSASSIATSIQNALAGLTRIGSGNVTVVGVDNLDNSYTFTISFAAGLGNVPTITPGDTARFYSPVIILEQNNVDGLDPTYENFTVTGTSETVIITDSIDLNTSIAFDGLGFITSIAGTAPSHSLASGGEGQTSLTYECIYTGTRNTINSGGNLQINTYGTSGTAAVRLLDPSLSIILSGSWKPIANSAVVGNGTIFPYNVSAGTLQTYLVSCGFNVTVTGGPIESGSNFIVTWNDVGPQPTQFQPDSYSDDPEDPINLHGEAITYSISSIQEGRAGIFAYNFNPIILDEDADWPKNIALSSVENEINIGSPKIILKECKGVIEGWRYYYPPLAKTPLYNQRKGAWVAANTIHIQNLTGRAKYCKRK